MQIVNETTFKFSLLGSVILFLQSLQSLYIRKNANLLKKIYKLQKNATDGGRFLVSRGVNNIHDLGRVLKYQNEPELGDTLILISIYMHFFII